MDWLVKRLDRWTESLCAWLNSVLPGGHGLALAGERLAGIPGGVLLPVDRRLGLGTKLYMANTGDSMMEKAKPSALPTTSGNSNEYTCGFWAYCHISGQPCFRCQPAPLAGSINSLLPGRNKDLASLCATMGKTGGTFWFGCCRNPAGEPKLIGFGDCCSKGSNAPQDCAKGTAWCENWPDAKNWCFSSSSQNANFTYYCTIVIDTGGDSTCK
jgi:hypothetical protein